MTSPTTSHRRATTLTRRAHFTVAVRRILRGHPLGVGGALVVLALVAFGAMAHEIAQYSPNQTSVDSILRPPSSEHWFGTDRLGRDVFSRVAFGIRVSFGIAGGAALLGGTAGGVLGVIGGYAGGALDNVIQRVMDVLMSFPSLILGLAVVAALGGSPINVAIAIAIPIVPRAARIVRSQAIAVRNFSYIEAARATGGSNTRILLRHVVPNCMAPYIIITTIQLGHAILVEAAFGFLGLGVPPPNPSLGRMLSGDGIMVFATAPWLATFPGVAIMLAVAGVNFIGDSLRDILDPMVGGFDRSL